MKTFCLAFVLTAIVAALLADVTAQFVGQVPVLPPGVVAPPPGDLCDSCNAYAKCKNGTCCVRPRSISGFGVSSICKPLGQHGEECSVAPTKGDIYVGHCPCKPGLKCRTFKPNIKICVREK
uniref:Putative ixodegrin protein n=1 Tax=Ixodes ricinus TaxID=34613 RepID=A0A0K8RID2_IXORI